MKTLVLGGVRSGKSQLAENMAAAGNLNVSYIATARLSDAGMGDAEMRERIDLHRARRPLSWASHEEPVHLAGALRQLARTDGCLLVDCLSLWMTNLLLDEDAARIDDEIAALLDFVADCPGELIFVSTESNLGVVPMGELSRRYCDRVGLLHQDIARQCDRVILTVAGLPHYLKGEHLKGEFLKGTSA
jgi:adenosylcobinamide kinase/adenosylcobinamide-phosphate guanylyltransferase